MSVNTLKNFSAVSVFAFVVTAASGAAFAQDTSGSTVYAGVALTSDYVSDGITQTQNSPALQGYVEFESSGGFYVNAWASNVDFEGDDDFLELDLGFGYRGEAAGLSYDIGYARYLYDDSGDCCGEIIAQATASVTDSFTVETYATYDPQFDDWSLELSPDFAVTDSVSLSARIGYKDSYDAFYGDIGATWSVTDTTSIDVRWADADGDDSDGIFFATVSFDTTLFGG